MWGAVIFFLFANAPGHVIFSAERFENRWQCERLAYEYVLTRTDLAPRLDDVKIRCSIRDDA